jgi:hypothetical protein
MFGFSQRNPYIAVVKSINQSNMNKNKRIKSEVEKSYIARLWMQRKRYNAAKRECDGVFGTFADVQAMRKAAAEMQRLRGCLERYRARLAA